MIGRKKEGVQETRNKGRRENNYFTERERLNHLSSAPYSGGDVTHGDALLRINVVYIPSSALNSKIALFKCRLQVTIDWTLAYSTIPKYMTRHSCVLEEQPFDSAF